MIKEDNRFYDKNSMYRQCKNPKGTVDYTGLNHEKLEWLIETLTTIFKRYDSEFLRTPVFELKKVLLQKYGEEAETKLLYHINEPESNQEREEGQTESEALTLRYDHTIPLVRYLIQHKIQKGKFARIGEVFRRDTPSKKQVRLRSFWQADFDFVGDYSPMEPEILLFSMINDFFKQLDTISTTKIMYTILFNFRSNLFKIFEVASVPKELYATIASSVDKLDKQPWDEVSVEMKQKGLNDEQLEVLKDLFQKDYLDPELKDTYDSLIKLNSFANPNQTLQFQSSLARGLDYYSGIIFEVIVRDVQGSVLAGGRYDGLIESYKGGKGAKIPLIGLSFGLNRLLPLVDDIKRQEDYVKRMKVYLAHIGDDLLESKIKLYRSLVQDEELTEYFVETDFRNGRGYTKDIPLGEKYYFETSFKKKKLAREINKCTQEDFDLMIVLAPSEEENDEYQIKIIKDSSTCYVKKDALDDFLKTFGSNMLLFKSDVALRLKDKIRWKS